VILQLPIVTCGDQEDDSKSPGHSGSLPLIEKQKETTPEEGQPFNQEIRKKARLPLRFDLSRLKEELSRSDSQSSKEELKSMCEEDDTSHLNVTMDEIFAKVPPRKVLVAKNNNQFTFI
jgi:hypothetical protein